LASVGGALLAWLGASLAARFVPWNLAVGVASNAAAFAIAIYATRHAMGHSSARRGPPSAMELPLRAVLVGLLVTGVVGLSAAMGPTFTGIFATAPVVMTSLGLILHPRLGGQGAAAVMAASVRVLPGLAFGYALLNLTAERVPIALALTLALLISLFWPLGLILLRRAKASHSA
jgi:hypothetical protein